MRILEFIKKNNIIILFFLTLICMTIGFATYNQILNTTGSVGIVPGGVIEITNVDIIGLTNASADPELINNNTGIDFNLSFTTAEGEDVVYEAIFDITISNQTFNDFVFNMPDYKLDVDKVTEEGIVRMDEYAAFAGLKISNAEIGDKIPAKTKKTFRITFTFSNPEESYNVTYLINSDFVPNVSKDDESTLMGSVANSETGDLTGSNETAKFTMKVINTHSTEQKFTIDVKNTDKFAVQNSETQEYTIAANSQANFDFYLMKVEGAEYPYSSANVDIIIKSQGVTYSTGSVNVLVDQTIVINDNIAPTISNVVATIGDTENTAYLTWDAEDNVKIDNYIIYVYKQDKTTEETKYQQVNKIDTQSFEKSATISDLEEGIYYFTVCGIDNSNNTATQEEIDDATTDAGTASRSEDIELIWNFNVTINVTNIDYTGDSTVKRGDTYTATFTRKANSSYKVPESLDSVTMGGVEYSNYTFQDGVVTIPNVTGDIVIKATGIWDFTICLVEGTKILLADGSYKNIEDIEYTDLLAVYDHLNGGITNVYPVWIEKEGGITSVYEKITFDDGTYIKVAGQHCLFDCERNAYVDVSNEEEFGIGSKVYKIDGDKLKIVTATKIEYIQEEVKYYDVLSTTHYNIIANDLITTDIITKYTNILYGFKEKAVFAKFDKVLNSKQLEYSDASFIPYNLFKGCNLNNTLSLVENNYVDMYSLGTFLRRREKEQITKNGERYFIVTTSADKVNSININSYLYREESIYTFPKIGAKYFIDTSTNKIYKEGEKYTVYNSTHFKVIY